MAIVYIGIAVAILIMIVLLVKVSRSKKSEFLAMNTYCKKCGSKTNGLKCPRCDTKNKSTDFGYIPP